MNNTVYKIKLELLAGSRIYKVCQDAVTIAYDTGMLVEFTLNGIKLTVTDDINPATKAAEYWRLVAEKNFSDKNYAAQYLFEKIKESKEAHDNIDKQYKEFVCEAETAFFNYCWDNGIDPNFDNFAK